MIPEYMKEKLDIYQQSHYNHELNIRKEKLSKIRKDGLAFPNDFRRSHLSSQLYKQYSNCSNQELLRLNIEVNVAGRMINQRIIGKVSFAIIQDISGKIQIYITNNALSINLYKNYVKQWDIGDIIGARGTLFKTRTGELSVYCKEIKLLTKSLRPLPEKFHGLNNQEIKYRQRYLDLIINDQSRKIFKMRSLIISEIRKFMIQRDFMEVETPMMHAIPGGASARPFTTYHNKLGINMYLRIAPELYLKQLVIGGFEKIFEINRNFRNEGISPNHNPEFTMMEIYMAYVDYQDLICLIQDLLRVLSKTILGDTLVKYGKYNLNFDKPFMQMSIKEALYHYLPEIKSQNIKDDTYVIGNIIRSLGIKIDDNISLNEIYMIIFEKLIVRKIIQPTCINFYPIEISPLARRNNNHPMYADRFELFIAGQEIGNGFSELNDPEDQRERFLQQIKIKGNDNISDEYNQYFDEDYLIALEYGLPPTAGVGIGIDRLIMLLTDTHTIRDVILFPTLRPK